LAERNPWFSPSKNVQDLAYRIDVAINALSSYSVDVGSRVSTPSVSRRIG